MDRYFSRTFSSPKIFQMSYLEQLFAFSFAGLVWSIAMAVSQCFWATTGLPSFFIWVFVFEEVLYFLLSCLIIATSMSGAISLRDLKFYYVANFLFFTGFAVPACWFQTNIWFLVSVVGLGLVKFQQRNVYSP